MLKSLLKKVIRNRRGAAFVEYALLIGGIALIGAAAVATFGHKTSDMLAAVAAVLPGAHTDDNNPIISGKIIETTGDAVGAGGATGIALDFTTIKTNSDGTKDRLGLNIGGTALGSSNGLGGMVIEAQ